MSYPTCGRCGVADERVLDLDTGNAYHRDMYTCVMILNARCDALTEFFHLGHEFAAKKQTDDADERCLDACVVRVLQLLP